MVASQHLIVDIRQRHIGRNALAHQEIVDAPPDVPFAASLHVCLLYTSGFEVSEFTFFGFLPRQRGELCEKLIDMARRSRIAVVHESPHRVRDLLSAVAGTLPHTRVSVS